MSLVPLRPSLQIVSMHVKSVETQTSSRWCGGKVKKGVPAQVLTSSPDHFSKLRGPSPIAQVQLYSET
ncbi:hypothetical protein TNCV_701221 [Trichonephila clavipes]|nr:hypothetical protein TNCV_701221 [Trichonephila clavipes]